ncbi:MAG: hypothetical protein RLZZ501_1450, partial [Pseudomonadota bacterium]
MNRLLAATALGLVLGAGVAAAAEHPIGRAIERDGMRIAAVYLQGVMMEGMEHDAHDPGAVHLEADIHA